MLWLAGKSTGSKALMKEVGIGSSAQDLEFPDRISLETFSIETLANDLSGSTSLSNLDGVVGCSSSSILLSVCLCVCLSSRLRRDGWT